MNPFYVILTSTGETPFDDWYWIPYHQGWRRASWQRLWGSYPFLFPSGRSFAPSAVCFRDPIPKLRTQSLGYLPNQVPEALSIATGQEAGSSHGTLFGPRCSKPDPGTLKTRFNSSPSLKQELVLCTSHFL